MKIILIVIIMNTNGGVSSHQQTVYSHDVCHSIGKGYYDAGKKQPGNRIKVTYECV